METPGRCRHRRPNPNIILDHMTPPPPTTETMDGNNSGTPHVAQSDVRPGGFSPSALCRAPLPLDALCQLA